MPELVEPLSPSWRRTLRRAVLAHALGERRQRHLPLLHVGSPGGAEWIVPGLPEPPGPPGPPGSPAAVPAGGPGVDDHALRVDVLAALLHRTRSYDAAPGPLVWLTRAGDLALQDVDAAWTAAACAAAGEADVDLTLVVVNRHGWRDPRTGTAVQWKRLRSR